MANGPSSTSIRLEMHAGEKSVVAMQKRLAALGPAGRLAIAHGLYNAGEDVMGDSKENYVPVDMGGLKGSGFVNPPVIEGSAASWLVRVVLGYGNSAVKYARIVHENRRAGNTGGVSPSGRKYKTWAAVGGWKFLERPLLKSRKRMMGTVAAQVTKAWRVLLK